MPNNLPQPPSNDQVTGFFEGIKSSVRDLWAKYSIFFIVVGIMLLFAKFGSSLMDLIAYFSKKTLEDAQKKDGQLKTQEDAANQAANQLRKEANELPKTETPVDEDWYKNGKK